ncbi:MAG: hypothetical protein IK118_08915 [Clostridia bacterium]|nr:hypothetical protein [Clostridia bacterium]
MPAESRTFTFESLPQNVEELKAMPEADFSSPFATAALVIAALNRYEKSPKDCIDMLNYLRQPRPMSVYEQQFLRDRLGGKAYVPRSYFAGTSPQNDYTPTMPYTVTISAGPYAFNTEGYATLTVVSSGADSPRQIQMRAKGGTVWYWWENFLLPDIRIPVSMDPWA